MSSWNVSMGKALMTMATDAKTAVYAERSKVRMGYPCGTMSKDELTYKILGPIESVCCEIIWNCHQKLPDTQNQHQVLKGSQAFCVALFIFDISDLQKIEGLDLLRELFDVIPIPIASLIHQLASTLIPEKTRTRYIEIGPIQWWLKNLPRCPFLHKLLRGGRLASIYHLSTITLRLTNLPIQNRLTGRSGLLFVDFKCHLSILTPHLLTEHDSSIYCRHYSKNEWSDAIKDHFESGTLVSILQ